MTSELPALWMEESPLELSVGPPSTLKSTAKTAASGSTKVAAAAKPQAKCTSSSSAKEANRSSTTAAATATSKAKARANAAPATLPALTQASLVRAAQAVPSSQPSLSPPRGPGSDVDSEVGSLPEVSISPHHQPRPTTRPLGLHRSATRAEDILKPPPFQQYYGTASTLRPKAFFQAAEAHKVCFRVEPMRTRRV